MKKMLAILGSPHLHGATATMLRCATESASQAGWQVDMRNLYQMQIAYCRGCRSCMDTKECIQKDDIAEIERLLKACDVVTLAAPTYWANVPGVVKNLFDRLLGTAMEETSTFPKARLSPKQKYLLLTACNTPFPFSHICGQSRGCIHAMNEFFKTSGMKRLGVVTFPNAKGRNQLPAPIQNKIRSFWGSVK